MPDYNGAFKDLVNLCKDKGCGPILIRLSWHDAGTFCPVAGNGGSRATIRFGNERLCGANAGLDVAHNLIADIKKKYSDIGFADFFVLGGVAAVKAMGGPQMGYRPGRKDGAESECAPDGRLPDAMQGAGHLRDIFHRMKFSDKDIVALSGAHSVGRCHPDRSGFDGPWCSEPLVFDNCYFKNLLEKKWTHDGKQYWDDEKKLMMLNTDMALIEDPEFKKHVEIYAKDQDAFFQDFAAAFQTLQENGHDSLGDNVPLTA